MTRILIADDQPLVRVGLRKILEAEPELEVVAELLQQAGRALDVREQERDGAAGESHGTTVQA